MSIMEHPHSATGAAADVAGNLKQWLDAFRAEHGRPPRVLHVGNIANNAYNNAKLLREAGLDCDVLCHDYYHIMGCPEWEDADFDGPVGDHFRPQWKDLDLHGYRRPAWFAQGPLWSSLRYLIVRREGRAWRAKFFWRCLQWANGTRDRDAASRGWHGPAAALTWLRRRGDARQTGPVALLADDAAHGPAGKTPMLSPAKPLLHLGLPGPGGLDAGLCPGTLIRRGLALGGLGCRVDRHANLPDALVAGRPPLGTALGRIRRARGRTDRPVRPGLPRPRRPAREGRPLALPQHAPLVEAAADTLRRGPGLCH